MKRYIDLIEQTFEFPTREFGVDENHTLLFNNVRLTDIIKEYGTPLKITYLPKIAEHIDNARLLFRNAMKKYNYKGSYTYCYCTKSSHFRFIIETALKNNVHLETSSSFDMDIIRALYEEEKINKNTYIICNGYKRPRYLEEISALHNDGFVNCIPILDNLKEIDYYLEHSKAEAVNLGIRIATDEEPNFAFYTSRLGVRYNDVNSLYLEKIKPNPRFKLKMLHFFINAGIKDNAYYWSELTRFMFKYCEMKKLCPELDSIDIGGGLPIQTSLVFNYDYQAMIDEIIENIQWICNKNNVPVPHIFTEFGSYTVGESGAVIYKVIDKKQQNDRELWYMIDGSFITQLPDSWGIGQKYIMMPVNNWDSPYEKVNLGGLTCDSADFYNTEAHSEDLYLPIFDIDNEDQYIGFFHTGAYQESLGGYGGIQHCLIPAPQHVLVNLDDEGNIITELFSPEQDSDSMMKILGFKDKKSEPAKITTPAKKAKKNAEEMVEEAAS
ncbi:Orn/DAP/Arg decarboxylase 2 [Emticicia oligotrophica DSM 17448]|uniref:Orn/DAP/Arg decarboxylase 2 n=1 Tax=Emticicia oligotrophica (strain DSM 17448 / CIP 109782 / MTCC 6937 / GPTSA100-15) TaxID=929562 RepID=A0ABN4AN17_EMTOG|nr:MULTISPECIES: decarboxylase [Emticicia]AFK03753.1 Orn/DAP/Arg decarboxylase 2 [Emticicia oligotrophica DSM 17448]